MAQKQICSPACYKNGVELHEVQVPEGRPVRLAVISDTHSRAHPDAARLVESLHPDLILHAGDIGTLDVLRPFEALAPTLAVRGNIDPPDAAPEARLIALRGENGDLARLLLQHVAVYGAKLRRDARARAREHRARLVICGHSHVPLIADEGGTLVFNPGSIGPRRFHLPICFGFVELGPGHASLRHIDCETGEAWAPPA